MTEGLSKTIGPLHTEPKDMKVAVLRPYINLHGHGMHELEQLIGTVVMDMWLGVQQPAAESSSTD